MTDKDKRREPMDSAIREVAEPVAVATHSRVCYAVQTLVAEFHALFPETPVEYTEVNGRNVALGVVFDLTTLDEETDRIDAGQLFRLLQDAAYNNDPRIDLVVVDNDTENAAVIMNNSARTMDSREPFGLADALAVLTGEDLPEPGTEIVWDGDSQ